MKKRTVKIALGQFASIHGETQQNLNKMLTMTDHAAERGADLIVFPELAYSGYFCPSYQMLSSVPGDFCPRAGRRKRGRLHLATKLYGRRYAGESSWVVQLEE